MSASENQPRDPFSNFLYALKAPDTRRQYPQRLKVFLNYLKLEGSLEEQARKFYAMAHKDLRWVQDQLISFILFQKDRVKKGEISEVTIRNYYKPVKLFCEMNDLNLNWKKISRGLPAGNRSAKDRAPTIDEIRKLVEYPDRRIKPIVFVMASSGIRIGAWDYLKWKHVTPLKNENGQLVAAKLLVYPGDSEQYFTFITPEAYRALKEWMDFRAQYGEKITGESWLMRDLWRTTNIKYGANFGIASRPRQLKSSGIKTILIRALREQGIRGKLGSGEKNHEWKAAHGFRKRFKTICEEVMRPINVELLMGHDIGVSESYYRPTEREILEDYLKVVPRLTISDEARLEAEVKRLQSGISDMKIIEGHLAEKDKEILLLKQKYSYLEEKASIFAEAARNMQELLKDPKKLFELIKAAQTNSPAAGSG